MPHPLPLKAIAAFHAAARLGSVSRAAEALGVSPSAVSQQIRFLEHHLGTSLFVRQNRRVTLTEAGERYFESLASAMDLVERATQRIRGYKAANVLSVRAAPSFATKWILPRLQGFLDLNPGFSIRIDATNEHTDFDREGIDVDIRYGKGDWPGFYVESLAREDFVPMASPALVPANSIGIRDVLDCRLIHSVKALVSWTQFFQANGLANVDLPLQGIQFDRSFMAVDAAARGLGVALESPLLAQDELAAGTLVCPVRGARPIAVRAVWLVCPHKHLRMRKVERFVDWLRAGLVAFN